MENSNYEKLSLAIDVIACAYVNGTLSVLMVKRKRSPFLGKWGLIGGFVNVCPRDSEGHYVKVDGKVVAKDESIADAAERIIKRDIGLSNLPIKVFDVYSNPRRDSRSRIVSACHYVMIPNPDDIKLVVGESISDYRWFPYDEQSLPEKKDVAFDNYQMILDFREELKVLFRNSPIAFQIVGNRFTLPQIKGMYEFLYDKKLDNFSRYISHRYRIQSLDTKVPTKVGRPAVLYEYLGISDEF